MLMLRSRSSWVAALAFVGLALGQADELVAATYSINPTRILLSAKSSSALLTLRNESDEPLRFQVTGFVWKQTAAGEMELKPTDDIVFFPALFTLEPKQERRIRVGTTVSFGSIEKSYRIFVEELPPPKTKNAPGSVRVLTRMGVPVFLQPAVLASTAGIEAVGRVAAGYAFTVRNSGNVHFIPDRVRVRALGGDGVVITDAELPSWYILAGSTRVYTFDPPRIGCERVRRFLVDVQVGQSVITERLETPAGACGPTR